MKRFLILFWLLVASVSAQVIPVPGAVAAAPTSSITGILQTPTGGTLNNATLSFTLSQPAVVAGSSTIVPQASSCYTSTTGAIVGLPDPLTPPTETHAGGSMPSGTYYLKYTYTGAAGVQSSASPESVIVLSAGGGIIVSPPTVQPSAATGYSVYIGTTSGGETLQGSAVGWVQYANTQPLNTLAVPPPTSNTTFCDIYFSDQMVPTGTYYTVSLTNQNGGLVSGYPQTWCTYGGGSGTINVSNGAPTGNCNVNGVFYPTPIMANPQQNASQSISGPLSLPGGVLGPLALTAPGVFNPATPTQTNAFSSLVNGINPTSIAVQNGVCCSAFAGVTGGVTIPPFSQTVTVSGLSGYVNDLCDSYSGGSPGTGQGGNHCNGAGLFSVSQAGGDGAYIWGAVLGLQDDGVSHLDTGFTGLEIDMGTHSVSPTRYYGIDLIGGTVPSTFTMPGGSFGMAITGPTKTGGGAAPWPYGLIFSPAASSTALLLYPSCLSTAGACPSQNISILGQDSGGNAHTAVIAADSSGNLNLTPATNTFVNINGGLGLTGNVQFSASKGQHIQTQAVNNDIAGTCTVASGTTCSVSFTFAYATAASCVVTPMTNVGAFYISLPATPTSITTGFTITYANSGASTFNYICMGNPN